MAKPKKSGVGMPKPKKLSEAELRKALTSKPKTAGKSFVSPATTGMKKKMIASGVPAKCAITGYANIRLCEAAHVFPDCWIKDNSYKTRLAGFLPKKDITKKLLDGPSNRIIMTRMVHASFDGKTKRASKLGCWGLVEKVYKKTGLPVPHTYVVVVKPAEVKDMKDIGVVDGAEVKLTHVDPRLVAWHSAQFGARLPTAGADGSDSELDDDDDEAVIDPLEAVGAAETLRSFTDEDAVLFLKRLPLQEHGVVSLETAHRKRQEDSS